MSNCFEWVVEEELPNGITTTTTTTLLFETSSNASRRSRRSNATGRARGETSVTRNGVAVFSQVSEWTELSYEVPLGEGGEGTALAWQRQERSYRAGSNRSCHRNDAASSTTSARSRRRRALASRKRLSNEASIAAATSFFGRGACLPPSELVYYSEDPLSTAREVMRFDAPRGRRGRADRSSGNQGTLHDGGWGASAVEPMTSADHGGDVGRAPSTADAFTTHGHSAYRHGLSAESPCWEPYGRLSATDHGRSGRHQGAGKARATQMKSPFCAGQLRGGSGRSSAPYLKVGLGFRGPVAGQTVAGTAARMECAAGSKGSETRNKRLQKKVLKEVPVEEGMGRHGQPSNNPAGELSDEVAEPPSSRTCLVPLPLPSCLPPLTLLPPSQTFLTENHLDTRFQYAGNS